MVAPSIERELHGPLPVFPIPEFVLFPSVQTPLYIFEPRYRRLVEDCLDQQGLFCLTSYEQHPASNMGREPAMFTTGCLARIVDYQKLEDGCYHILVEGVSRVRMQEVEGYRGYRRVMVEALSLKGADKVDDAQVKTLRRLTESLCPENGKPDLFKRYLDSLDLEDLLNLMSFHGLASLETRQHLLESTSIPDLCNELIDLYKLHC